MKKSNIFKLWLLMFFLATAGKANAYYTHGFNASTKVCDTNPVRMMVSKKMVTSPILVDQNSWSNLQSGQYLRILGTLASDVGSVSNGTVSRECKGLSEQVQTGLDVDIESPRPSGIIVARKTSIVGGASYDGVSNDSTDLYIIPTNIVGLYYSVVATDPKVKSYLPWRSSASLSTTSSITYNEGVAVDILIDKTFQGLPAGSTVTPAVSTFNIIFRDRMTSVTDDKGITTVQFRANPLTYPDGIKLKPTCTYSISDNGVVDFGEQSLSKVTADRKTTLKKTLNLSLQCTGADKVHTYISNVSTTVENGLLLPNSLTDFSDAKNVAIGLGVSANSTENAGSDIYMDGSHKLEWQMTGTYSFTSVTRTIPLDVFLLRSSGEPTGGEYKATATILVDFI